LYNDIFFMNSSPLMKVSFYKYHGTGNDFIILDNRSLQWNPSHRQVAFLCDRHFGIGSDGLMLLSEEKGYDFRMTYFNSDGNESSMCGNGGRCMTAFAKMIGIIDSRAYFSAIDGAHESLIIAESEKTTLVKLKMKNVTIEEPVGGNFFIDTGSPHYVIFGSNIGRTDVVKKARKIRYDTCFAEEGTNVDFVEIKNDHLFVRSYERGVEDETLSCGTGITASALAAAMRIPGNQGFFNIKSRGGDLTVHFKQAGNFFSDIWLEGAAEMVFGGEIEIRE
jgi:diaminopimelate epimerase